MCKLSHASLLILIKLYLTHNDEQILHLHFLQFNCKQLRYKLHLNWYYILFIFCHTVHNWQAIASDLLWFENQWIITVMIILHNTISMLWIHITVFNCFVDVHHLFTIEKIVKKYSLNVTSLHISMQHVNSLAAVINIQNENIIMRDADYSAAIIYFENLMKHLNVRKTISMMKTALLDNCFKEWCKKIKNMILAQKCLELLR